MISVEKVLIYTNNHRFNHVSNLTLRSLSFMITKKSSVIFTLLDAPAWGGAEEYVFQNLLALTEKHHVVVATNNTQVKAKISSSNITVVHLPYVLDAIGNWKGLVKYFLSLPHSIIWLIWQLVKLKKEHSSVICMFPGYSDRLTFSPIVKALGCTLFWWEFGPLESTFTKNWGFPKLLFWMSRSLPDKIITISNWTKMSLKTTGKINPQDIILVYPGVTNLLPKGVKINRENVFPQNIPEKYIITCLGRIAQEKEFDVVIKAISQLEKNVKEKIHLIIIGSGPNVEQLEQLAKQLEIEKKVTFTGFVSNTEKHHILANSDIFIFPSAWELEGFGMTTIEAMIHHNAIITTGHGPQAEIIDNGKNGLYVEPKNVSDLVQKIEELIKNPKLIKKLQQSAYETAIKKFSFSRMQKQIKNVVDECKT